GFTSPGMAEWTGGAWVPRGNNLTESDPNSGGVTGLAAFDDGSGEKLYAAGPFRYAGGIFALNVAAWDGFSWSPLAGVGEALFGAACLAVFDDGGGPALYIGGNFPGGGAARWDG